SGQPQSGQGKRESRQVKESGDRSAGELSDGAMQLQREAEQSRQQWLRRIPDDPGGLLRRKFQYQYRQRGEQREERQSW
ncbi:MAG: hypothetical protein Q9M13_08845, partial [Mariprofundales bacterium]|nr:hypothetical protein [Mariprofundales bacterium]